MQTWHFKRYSIALCMLIIFLQGLGQEKLKFQIEKFSQDVFDTSASNPKYEKFDGNGDRYAIIKVTSDTPDDDLRQLNFNFGNMKHEVKAHDGELWVYVQRNAKTVSITREGYAPVNRYDLRTTIEPGKNYVMEISSQEKKIYRQMVRFDVAPANSGAAIMIRNALPGSQEELFGNVGSDGSIARTLECGVYEYRVMARDYHTEEGKLTLSYSGPALVGPQITEKITLRPNFSGVTLRVNADAEIYLDGEYIGNKEWKGHIKPGRHEVECRMPNHHNSTQSIIIAENEDKVFDLKVPQAKIGYLAVTSTPLGASISIGGKSYGQTPASFDLPVGMYELKLSKVDFKESIASFEIKENKTTEISKTLEQINSNDNQEGASKKKKKDYSDPLYTDSYEIKNTKPSDPPAAKSSKEDAKKKKDHSDPLYPESYDGKTTTTSDPYTAKSSYFYAELGGVVGQNMGLSVDLGAFIHNFNVEADYILGLKDCPTEVPSLDNVETKYISNLNLGLKVGYGFNANKHIKFTPQIGARLIKLSKKETKRSGFISAPDFAYAMSSSGLTRAMGIDTDYIISAFAIDASIGIRAEYSFNSHLGVSLTPQYFYAVYKYDNMKTLWEAHKKIKDMVEGFGVKASLTLKF